MMSNRSCLITVENCRVAVSVSGIVQCIAVRRRLIRHQKSTERIVDIELFY